MIVMLRSLIDLMMWLSVMVLMRLLVCGYGRCANGSWGLTNDAAINGKLRFLIRDKEHDNTPSNDALFATKILEEFRLLEWFD